VCHSEQRHLTPDHVTHIHESASSKEVVDSIQLSDDIRQTAAGAADIHPDSPIRSMYVSRISVIRY